MDAAHPKQAYEEACKRYLRRFGRKMFRGAYYTSDIEKRQVMEAVPIRGYLAVDLVTGRRYDDVCVWWDKREVDVADVYCRIVGRRGHMLYLETRDDDVPEEFRGTVYLLFLLERDTQDNLNFQLPYDITGRRTREGP